MSPVCLSCGLVGASYEVDGQCERCGGHYRALTESESRELLDSFKDVPLRPRKTWGERRDAAMRPALAWIRRSHQRKESE